MRSENVIRGDTMIELYTSSVSNATRCQENIFWIRSWKHHGSMGHSGCSSTARAKTLTILGRFGSERSIIFSGRTSGTPPTFVDTTNRPQLAASSMAIQNDSVKEQLKNTCPRTNASLTDACGTEPKNSTRSCNRSRSTISCKFNILGPSPPMTKSTNGRWRQTIGMIPTSRSMPLRNTKRDTTETCE